MPAVVCASDTSVTGKPNAIALRVVVSTQNSVCMPQITSAVTPCVCSKAASGVPWNASGVVLRIRKSLSRHTRLSGSCQSALPCSR
ncbi:hypothetical protein FQZ97_977340 [compost metagenome]